MNFFLDQIVAYAPALVRFAGFTLLLGFLEWTVSRIVTDDLVRRSLDVYRAAPADTARRAAVIIAHRSFGLPGFRFLMLAFSASASAIVLRDWIQQRSSIFDTSDKVLIWAIVHVVVIFIVLITVAVWIRNGVFREVEAKASLAVQSTSPQELGATLDKTLTRGTQVGSDLLGALFLIATLTLFLG